MKTRQFKSWDEYESWTEKFEEICDYQDIPTVIDDGWKVSADMFTECKSWKTALRRFFKAFACVDEATGFQGWFDYIYESCENGRFKDTTGWHPAWSNDPEEIEKCAEYGIYAWEVEEVDEGSWYVYLVISGGYANRERKADNSTADQGPEDPACEAGKEAHMCGEEYGPVQDNKSNGRNERETKAVTTYTDCWGRSTELTTDELNWFEEIVARAQQASGYTVPIIPYDHDRYDGKSKDALGCCVTTDPKNQLGPDVETYITIDCYFINECWRHEFNGDPLIAGATLQEVIAHELAHLTVWRHGKKHRVKSEELLRQFVA